MVDVEELRERFLNLEYDTKAFEFDAQDAADAARYAGETLPEFIDPTHENFEVSCAFLASFASGRRLPIDFPSLGAAQVTAQSRRRGFAASLGAVLGRQQSGEIRLLCA